MDDRFDFALHLAPALSETPAHHQKGRASEQGQRRSPDAWVGAGLLIATAAGLFEASRRAFAHQWGTIQEAIEAENRQRGAR